MLEDVFSFLQRPPEERLEPVDDFLEEEDIFSVFFQTAYEMGAEEEDDPDD